MPNLNKPSLVKIILAALVVFVMTTGAFVGAADKSLIGSNDDTTKTSIEIETLDHATYTEE
ncbi:MAG: hypothetical protein KAJ51_02370, partial [Thermoplasmata archaeon]|nr:hypothetical protein [Thermoplasmata archaeon]